MTAPTAVSARTAPVAVLTSGGVDSAVLVARLGRDGRVVRPVYVRFGLGWEDVELGHLECFLATLGNWRIGTLVVLEEPVADVYGQHWSVTGTGVPGGSTPDEAVYLPGRNLLLLAKASVWCALNGIRTIALGTLAANPFPDADRAFFQDFGALAARALGEPFEVVTPFADRAKSDVLEEGRDLALDLTFSCIAPQGERHCGRCNKCAERRRAFDAAAIDDTTEYAT